MDRQNPPGVSLAERPLAPAAGAKWVVVPISTVACVVGLAALAMEARISFHNSFAKGRGWAETTFLYLRYFTITTNFGLAWLHGTTAFRLLRGRRLPSGGTYDAWLVYAVVTGATYELLLRSSWSPQGAEFVSDLMLHDVVPLSSPSRSGYSGRRASVSAGAIPWPCWPTPPPISP